jgi:hypothetical protein
MGPPGLSSYRRNDAADSGRYLGLDSAGRRASTMRSRCEAIRKIAGHPDAGALGRLMSANDPWRLPDFRPWFVTLDSPECTRLYREIAVK